MSNLAHTNAISGSPGSIPQSGPETAQAIEIVTSDRVRHPVRFWQGAIGAPVVLYLHGIEGHSRWFESTALALNEQAISVYAPDRRGAGASAEKRGDISTYTRLVEDVEEIVRDVARRHPSSPLVLLGNCWGGKLAITAAARDRSSLIRGLILTSPAVSTQVDVTFATKIKIALSYFVGGGSYFDIPLAPEHFTDNPPYLEYVDCDSQRLKQATARFFIESLKLTRACKQATPNLRLPVLLLQSGRDAIVNQAAIERWFNTVGSADKTLKIFTTAAHSLDFEANPTEYQSLLAEWIHSRAAGSRFQVPR